VSVAVPCSVTNICLKLAAMDKVVITKHGIECKWLSWGQRGANSTCHQWDRISAVYSMNKASLEDIDDSK
jgi:hypothetical protein